MVLDKFGSGLKQAFRKVVGLGVVDKEAVEAVVRELQRALLQADVDVKMVSELSDSIRERVLKAKLPPGMTLKEHFIKTLYDEIVRFLGAEKGGIELKKQRILVCGLFGAGKCVHPDSNIILSDGNSITAKNLYEKFKDNIERDVDGGKILDITNRNIFVPSFNPKTLEMESKKVTHLWQLEGKELLEVKFDNGNDFHVKVTPEHPFFVLRNGIFRQIRADELNEDDFVSIPRKIQCKGKAVDIYPYLKNIDLYLKETPSKAREFVLPKYPTLKEAHKNLNFKNNYCKFTSSLKKGILPLEYIQNPSEPFLRLKLKNATRFLCFPRFMTAELAEFLGYIIGDGYIYHQYVEISNEDSEIIERFKELSQILFGIVPRITRDKRTKKMYKVQIASTTLVKLLNDAFNLSSGKKGKQLKIPTQIMQSDDDTIRAFLKAYFDCDSSSSNGARRIELSSESKPLISQTASLLLRFGIVSTISKKIINSVPYWRLSIGARYAETYAEKIGFRIKRKQKRADQYMRIGIRQGCGKHDMIPLGKTLKELRQSLGISIGEIQEYVTSYGRYEQFGLISRESLQKVIQIYDNSKEGKMLHILNNINNLKEMSKYSYPVLTSVQSYYRNQGLISKQNILTQKGEMYLESVKSYPKNKILNFVRSLANSDVCWVRVDQIKSYKNEEGHVYDLTVEDNHSFIADNIIVHNTTTIGKLGKWFKARGLKVGVVACDTHRPAAQDQLGQLAKNIGVVCHKEGKTPEDIAGSTIKKSKEDVIIFDSAGRDALDKELARELKELGKIIKPDEVLLVIPAEIGQDARRQAEEFNKLVGITGIVVTKLDGTAKAGGALSASAVSGAKVKFIGVGEKPQDIEEYDPQRFVSKLIGYGDLQGLMEKAKSAGVEVDKDKAERMLRGKFTMDDFYDQIGQMQKMGPLSKVAEMIPGMGKMNIPKDLMDVQEEKMKKWRFIIDSMTREEKENPEMIKASRIERIAKGSGTTESDVRGLLKYYKQTQKVMKLAKGGKGFRRGPLAALAKQFGMADIEG